MRKGRLWIIIFLVFSAGAFFIYRTWFAHDPMKIIYKEVKVDKGPLQVTVLATGVAQPQNRLEIKPPVAGRIESVLVDEGDQVKAGQVLAWMSSNERAALMDAARAKGPSEVKKWEALYKPTPVMAPIDGQIILRNVQAGQTFASNDAVLVMSNRLTVKAQLDETDIAKIKLKQHAEILLDAYPDKPIQGHADKIAFDAKTVNNVTTYIVDVLPDVVPDYMLSGMTANVTFQVAQIDEALSIPAEALKVKEGKFFVLTPNPSDKNKPLEVDVKTGLSDGKKIEITSGLNEGETLLVPEFSKEGKKSSSSPFSPMGRPRGK